MTSLPIQSDPSSRSGFPPLWPPIWPPLWRPQELRLGLNQLSVQNASTSQAGLSGQAISAPPNVSAGRATVQDSFAPSPAEPSSGNLYSDQLPFEATRLPPSGTEAQMPLLDQRIAVAQWQTQQEMTNT